MTEKEKMISGKPYLAFDEELFKERQFAKELIFICREVLESK